MISLWDFLFGSPANQTNTGAASTVGGLTAGQLVLLAGGAYVVWRYIK